MEYSSLKEIEEKIDFLHKMYDSIRIVDPVQKKVLDYRNASLTETTDLCYGYWENGLICENCISIRAYLEGRSYMKLEKKKSTVLLVTAVPIMNTERPVVLELLKNASDTMLVGEGNYNEGTMLNRFVREMNDIVTKDPLTTLYNRRFVEERLPADIIYAALNKLPLSLCFIDMDHLKEFNDQHGHAAGDWAIKAISGVIKSHIRDKQDWAARYGGDEFVLCLNNTDEEQAHRLIGRIQESLEEIELGPEMEKANLSFSYGINTVKDSPVTAEELLRSADQKMYSAKRRKRRME